MGSAMAKDATSVSSFRFYVYLTYHHTQTRERESKRAGIRPRLDNLRCAGKTTRSVYSSNIRGVDQRDLILLESAITAIDEAASAVAAEVERDRLAESSLARLSTVEAELKRSRLTLEKILREDTR